jgi:2-polyprenyl-3-methyl-5-hydroxy-6-metoxy-1,4-benzoquinol methylase
MSSKTEMSKNPIHELKKNVYGFYEVDPKPTQEQLNIFYANKYYQDGKFGSYGKSYSNEEIKYITNLALRFEDLVPDNMTEKTVLDVCCGEGFQMKVFKEKGYSVRGLDFSTDGISTHNPSLVEHFTQGDVFANLNSITEQFGCIILKHALEHVLDPEVLLTELQKKLTPNGVVIVVVPNDFSTIQKHCLENGMIEYAKWIAPPEHLSYFSFDSLAKFATHLGYNVTDYSATFPIDFDLLTEHTNYINDSSVGKYSHLKRLRTDNLLCDISIHKTNIYYKKLCEMGLGRDIIMVLSKV